MDVDVNWVETLISLIEKKPLLYNKSLWDYSNKDKKDKAWTEIFEHVNPDWGDLTEETKRTKGREIQQRWTNLRSCFQRELREQKKGTSGQAAKKRRKYIYFDHLLFLLPVLDERETESNLEAPESCPDEDDNVTDCQVDGTDLMPCCPPPSSVRQKKRHISYEQSLLDILKEKKDQAEEINGDKSFVLSLVPALKRLSVEKKFQVKMELMGVLHRHTMQTPSSSLPVPSYQTYSGTTASATSADVSNQPYRPISVQRSFTPSPSPSSSSAQLTNTFTDRSPQSEFFMYH